MKKNILIYILLTLFNIHLSFGDTNTLSTEQQIIDSLRTELNQKTGADKISVQLELALHILNKKSNDATELANSALVSASETGNRDMEMRAYYVLGRISFRDGDHALSEAYYNRALKISDAISENWYKGEIHFRKGVIEHQKGESLQALEHFNEAIQACRLSENYKIAGSSFSMMGTIFRLNGLYDRAIEYIIKSKLNYQKADFHEGYAWSAYLLGRVYADLKIPEQALEYFTEALDTYKTLAAIDGNKNGIAICYEQIGLINMEAGKLEEARRNINQVLNIHSESGSEYGLSNAYKNLGKIEYFSGDYEKAEEYLNKALVVKQKIEDLLSQPGIFEYIGLCKIGRENINEGIDNIKHALDLALRNSQKNIQLEIYSKLAETYLNLNDLEKALYYQKKQIDIQNSILSGGANIKIEQLQTIYELDEKTNQIADLEKQNEINTLKLKQQKTFQIMIITGLIFVLLISSIIFLFYRKLHLKNRELSKINTTKDRFFSIIAHDLKGSIGSSLALSQIIAEDNETRKQSSENNYSALIFQSLSGSYSLLNNLLEWARSQFQKIELNPKQLVLANVIEEVTKQFLPQISKKDISIDTRIEGPQQVFADEGILKTTFRNLLSNAIKFSNPNGKIFISAKPNNKFIEFSVQDFGVGIEPEIIPLLFDFDSNTSTPGTLGENGTGLGLILVKELVEKHKGKIWVESEIGKGSIFKFTLPRV
ncbi:tetratricopeptide repeat protein [Maribellus comscasis]|uniref:histidine kinase n=1 Tax=Maribellus comscasis TaxID=2681766 RepID=A0A6I6JT76_9BACT|nr:tetratricopeptide repeat protein [Maribellus comscasis]QGY44310.1 tetratricopeptide repeat protein [Maribellus comscasis]